MHLGVENVVHIATEKMLIPKGRVIGCL